MMLNDVKIGMENIVADPSKETVEAVSARSDTDKSSVVIGYRLEILTRRGSRNTVKLPMNEENQQNIEKVSQLLKKQDTVEIMLAEPVVRLYALISNDRLISGVSIKASSFSIVEPEDEDLLD